jgi:hypothetical protein
MAEIEHEASGQRAVLECDHLVGRSQRCTLRVHDEHVSNEHASIRWNGESWVLKDLGSLNRTTVDRYELTPSESVVLKPGARIAFGSPSQTWVLINTDAPVAMAVPEDGSAVVAAIDGLLALPSVEDPSITVHRNQHGAWTVEGEGGGQQVSDQSWVQAGGRRFRLCLPQVFAQTARLQGFVGRRIADLAITFRASRDLEHIELEVGCDGTQTILSARVHNEILLVLARTRRQDTAQGIPSVNCGWMYQDELCRSVALESDRLNVEVYRIRRKFAELGLLDPAHIIERRARSRQLRIGVQTLDELAS